MGDQSVSRAGLKLLLMAKSGCGLDELGEVFSEEKFMNKRIICIITALGILGGTGGTAFSQTSTGQKLTYHELPKAVQKAIRPQRDDVRRIEQFSYNGKTLYEIQLNTKNEDKYIYVAQDGTRVTDKAVEQQRKSERKHPSAVSQNNSGGVVEKFDRPLAATEKVKFDSVPEAVKHTVREVAGSNRIEDAERGTLDGRTVYELAFKENGIHNELRVAEDGSIVQHMRMAAKGSETQSLGKVTVDQVPAPVRKTIRAQVGSGEVNDIDKKMVKGRTVYEVGFKKESGGRQHEIQIAEDGTFLGEASGAQK
jgi:uncharacterized membrane protein YkoI